MSARANGLRENAETAISCRGPGPARNKNEEVHAQICPCGKESITHVVGERFFAPGGTGCIRREAEGDRRT